MRACVVCGCTDDAACEGGCSWIVLIGKSRGVCSMCPVPIADSKLPKAQLATRRELRTAIETARRVLLHRVREARETEQMYRATVDQARRYEISLRRYGGKIKRGSR